MEQNLANIALIAMTAGFIHTLLGPDHYLPFILLSKSNRWPFRKTILITAFCGLAHILGAVFLGILLIKLNLTLERLSILEAQRGHLAGWALTLFGLIYLTWGLRLAFQKRVNLCENTRQLSWASWALFIIFVLGPCEPLIPLMSFPGVRENWGSVFLIAGIFGTTTILTMLSVVSASYFGLSVIRTPLLGRFAHAMAGMTLLLCGIGIQFLG